jgi:hypothetical protein
MSAGGGHDLDGLKGGEGNLLCSGPDPKSRDNHNYGSPQIASGFRQEHWLFGHIPRKESLLGMNGKDSSF